MAGEESVLRCFDNSLLHRGNELFRNRSAKNLVDEFKSVAARRRFDLDVAIAKLTVAAALLL